MQGKGKNCCKKGKTFTRLFYLGQGWQLWSIVLLVTKLSQSANLRKPLGSCTKTIAQLLSKHAAQKMSPKFIIRKQNDACKTQKAQISGFFQ